MDKKTDKTDFSKNTKLSLTYRIIARIYIQDAFYTHILSLLDLQVLKDDRC